MSVLQRLSQLCIKMPKFYAVARGRKTGVFTSWPECQSQVQGFKNSIFKKFFNEDAAKQFVLEEGGRKELTSDDELSLIPDSVLNGVVESTGTATASNDKSIKRKISDIEEYNDNVKLTLKEYNGMQFMEDDAGYVHVYTDGSCANNGKANAVAGLGVYFGELHVLNKSEPVSGRPTNNCGEIQASTMAIQLAVKAGIKKLCINTDSHFLINSVTNWMAGWKAKNWTTSSGLRVKNQSDFIALDRTISQSNLEIKWVYVKAHKGVLGNERADSLAKDGGEKYKRLKKIGKR